MRVVSLDLRDFRSYTNVRILLGEGLTVVFGPNGAGKTNLLEGLYFGCTGRSCRTTNEREVVRFGAATTRVLVEADAEDGPHQTAVGFTPGQAKRLQVDGANVERLLDAPTRPLVSVFMPDRLELIKGPPASRRAHADQLTAALWPARRGVRRAYGQALAQRNALIARIRAGRGSREALASWDLQLARTGIELMGERRRSIEAVAELTERTGGALGLEPELTLAYRPRSRADAVEGLLDELRARVEGDIERGFTGHGPHRDELSLLLDGHELRNFGSQGQQRVALLALLLAEREVIAAQRGAPPVMLLDDVMSELDAVRREALVDLLREAPGQAVITTTDLDHVPGATEASVVRIAVAAGGVLEEARV
ncbi:MAG TPA: DNA replication and repair protein RecF [Solirubrobacteraceae bacterium]|nr:DNA replication and repair protein RecF [Solirubrobacteraceae bacterium]